MNGRVVEKKVRFDELVLHVLRPKSGKLEQLIHYGTMSWGRCLKTC